MVVFQLAMHAGDWPEQCDLVGLCKGTQAGKPCNMCEISVKELFTSELGCPRTVEGLEATRNAAEAEEYEGKRGWVTRAAKILSEASMRAADIEVRHVT